MRASIFNSILLCLVLVCSGCTKPRISPEQVEKQAQTLNEQSKSRIYTVLDEPYLGAQPVLLHSGQNIPVLNTQVVLRKKGSLADILAAPDLPVTVQVMDDVEPEPDRPKTPMRMGHPDSDLETLLQLPAQGTGSLNASYEGTLGGLFDYLSSLSGYGWDYNETGRRVTFSHMQVKTFTLLSAPGTVTYHNQLTNKSKDNAVSGTIGGSGVSQTVSSGDSSAQTAQTNTTQLKFDVWEECERGVKSFISKHGAVVINQAAGTLTVRDTQERLRQIASYIEDINTRMSRQVALTVQVWSLEMNDDSDLGLNLQVLFQQADAAVIAGSLAEFGSANSASVSIVDGKLKGSSAAFKALRQWGTVSQVTSSGGVLMSNQPLPSLAIKRHAYLAGVSLNTNDYGQTSEITPGEVTTGFAMTVIPHILDKRRVILQYNINLSSLDDMVDFRTDDIMVQLPQVSTRSFAQRTTMKMGQTLVLAGFEQETSGKSHSVGILSTGKGSQHGKTLLIITIEVESAEV